MKKLVILMAAMVAGVTGAMAQGYLAGQNFSTSPMTVTNTGGSVSNIVGATGSLLAPASVRVQLWIGSNGIPVGSLIPITMITNSPSTLSLAWGTFNMQTVTLPAPYDGTFNIELLYRAWSISTGALTWDAANLIAGTYVGQSALLQNFAPGNPLAQPPPTAPPTFGAGLLGGIVLGPVIIPEPSTILLAGLGLASLLAIRRRK
jgi:hypothetical protein